jgi:hypothetical protein
LRQPRPTAVLAVIVGLGDQRDVRGLERRDRGRRRMEDVLLGLRVPARPRYQGGLEVRHRQVSAGEEPDDITVQCRGRIICQAHRQRPLEMHVAAEREGDGFAAAAPPW